MKYSLSTYFFREPGFIFGISRILDLGATLDSYNYEEDNDTNYYLAMLVNWKTVGNELRYAISQEMEDGISTEKS